MATTQLGFVDDREYPSFPKMRFNSAIDACRQHELPQYDTVLYVMQAARGFWVCGSFFYGAHLPSARNRISEIRADFDEEIIVSEHCTEKMHNHRRRSGVYRYRYTQ